MRRGFTILETVLAATLASLVVLGCMGAFLALDRTDRTLSARFEEANDLARIQRTMQRAFSTLLMAPESPLEAEEEAAGASAAEQQPQDGQNPGEEEQVPEESAEEEAVVLARPRVLLEPDLDPTLTSMINRARYSAGGGGTSVAAPQRLELVLSAVPVRPPSVQSTAWTQALVGVDDLAAEEAADALEAAEGEEDLADDDEYGGVRGAFVLRPDDPTERVARARSARGDGRTGWTLWWQPLDGRSEPARVASGLAACHYQMFYDRQMLDQHIGYAPTELPRYIQVEIETLTGLYANYLFEVVWTVDRPEDTQTLSIAGGNQGQQGQNGQNGQGGQNGAPNGPGPGGRPGDGDVQARPKGLTPQGAGPGRRLEGRPQRGPADTLRPPPDGGGGDRRRGPGDGGRGGGG